jgi:single-stranded-DNA-specific exonuclease
MEASMFIKQRECLTISPSLMTMPTILQRIYSTRGVLEQAQLDKRLQVLLPFNNLHDIDKACLRLEKALREEQRIIIIGDFDADGATATAVAISALKAMGAKHINYLVPNRFEFGYGLTPGIIALAAQYQPGLIITVDNGIASIEGVDAANALGIDVLITDHHLPADVLPKACAIVNPNQLGDEFASKSIAGVGVIFYVMVALRYHLDCVNWFVEQGIPKPNMAQFLDLVALGTVADVVGLDQNNRILVQQGLTRIRQGKCSSGIKALIEIAGRDCTKLRESDLGYAVAPRLNAAGRLDDMSLGIECLLCQNTNQARELAQRLDELNQERRSIEAGMKEQALIVIDALTKKLEYQEKHLPVALCLLDDTWHQGVIGILAGRLKERYHRPVIVFAQVNDHELKGSARSIPSLNIRDVLAAIERDNPGLMTKFGGHAMAAGLSLPPKNFAMFKKALICEVGRYLDISQCEGCLLTDGMLTAEQISLETALLLQQAGPWGQEFPEPCFDNVFEILEQRLVGQHHLKMTVLHSQGGMPIDAIAFNVDLSIWPNYRLKKAHIAYKLDINVYQGRSRLQLLVEALRPLN